MTHPYQPIALRDNIFSNAYFGALRQRVGKTDLKCAFCERDLSSSVRVSDGDTVWCDHGHLELWLRKKRDDALRRRLFEKGWSKEKVDGLGS